MIVRDKLIQKTSSSCVSSSVTSTRRHLHPSPAAATTATTRRATALSSSPSLLLVPSRSAPPPSLSPPLPHRILLSSGIATPTAPTSTTLTNPLTQPCRTTHFLFGHEYREKPMQSEPGGVDNLNATRAEQLEYNSSGQWGGYSDTYLLRPMPYMPPIEAYSFPEAEYQHAELKQMLHLVYHVYGEAAKRLESLYHMPLHQSFHAVLAQAVQYREELAAELDKVYVESHPTVKTMLDAYVVRRYYFLKDWEEAVTKKRAELMQRVSPEMLREMVRGLELAEKSQGQLALLANVLEHTIPLDEATSDTLTPAFNETEMEMLRQKVRYRRNMKKMGAIVGKSDHP